MDERTHIRRPRARITVSIIAAVAIGCGSPDDRTTARASAPWYAIITDSTTRWTLQARDPCLTCIALTRLVTLGDTSEAGFVVYTAHASMDSAGRFWLGQRGQVKVFDSTGAMVAHVGRPGSGPMEFDRPWPVHTDAAGRVHIIDLTNARQTVVAADLSLHAEHHVRLQNVFSLAARGDGESYAVTRWTPPGRGEPIPIQVVRRDSVIHSFGEPVVDAADDPFGSQRLVAADRDGRTFAVARFKYAVEAYSESGRRMLAMDGPALNQRPPKAVATNLTDNPLPNEIIAIRVDRQDRLWVLTQVVRDDWRSFMVEQRRPDGTVGLAMRPGMSVSPESLYHSRLEVIDLAQRRIAARLERRELFTTFIGDGLLIENREDDDGTPRTVVWRVGVGSR